jgi:hypothetical protein
VRHVLPVHTALYENKQLEWAKASMGNTLREHLVGHCELLKKAGLWESVVSPFLEHQVQS